MGERREWSQITEYVNVDGNKPVERTVDVKDRGRIVGTFSLDVF